MRFRYDDDLLGNARPSDAPYGWVIIDASGRKVNGPGDKSVMEFILGRMPDAEAHRVVPATKEETEQRGRFKIGTFSKESTARAWEDLCREEDED